MSDQTANVAIVWPKTFRAFYTRQIILAVFKEACCDDAGSLANETLDLLTDSCRYSSVLVQFHCSIASIPLDNRALSANLLSLSQEGARHKLPNMQALERYLPRGEEVGSFDLGHNKGCKRLPSAQSLASERKYSRRGSARLAAADQYPGHGAHSSSAATDSLALPPATSLDAKARGPGQCRA